MATRMLASGSVCVSFSAAAGVSAIGRIGAQAAKQVYEKSGVGREHVKAYPSRNVVPRDSIKGPWTYWRPVHDTKYWNEQPQKCFDVTGPGM